MVITNLIPTPIHDALGSIDLPKVVEDVDKVNNIFLRIDFF